MISTVCALNSGVSLLLPTVCNVNSVASPLRISHSQRKIAPFCCRSSWKPLPNIKLSSLLRIASKPFLHRASKPFLHAEQQSRSFHAIPILPNRRLLSSPPRASTNEPDQGLTEKPTFGWRILACMPYLLDTCLFVDTVRCILPFLKGLESCNGPDLLMSLLRIPRWLIILFLFLGVFVVERKEWPYFFRSHVLMSSLLLTPFLIAVDGSQKLGSWINAGYSQSLSCWKFQLCWGKIGVRFLLFASFAFMLLVLECMRRALRGMHIDVCTDGA